MINTFFYSNLRRESPRRNQKKKKTIRFYFSNKSVQIQMIDNPVYLTNSQEKSMYNQADSSQCGMSQNPLQLTFKSVIT